MKKILLCFAVVFICQGSQATTINLKWKVDGTTYSQTTCTSGDSVSLPATPTKYGYTFQGWNLVSPVIYGTVAQNGTPTANNPINPVFYQNNDLVLLALPNSRYYDTIDTGTRQITRRVGVKVFDGTEIWQMYSAVYIQPDSTDAYFVLNGAAYQAYNAAVGLCNQASLIQDMIWTNTGDYPNVFTFNGLQFHLRLPNDLLGITDYTQETVESALAKFKAFLAAQYANGTPVIVYYPLNASTTEYYTGTIK